jgi:outer membrane protein OmpA-like peptidoglycan-associated protein
MKNIAINTARMTVAIGLMGAGSVFASPFFIDKPRTQFPEFVMPQNIMMTADAAALIDTDPRSRQALAKLVKQYQGLEWKDARSGMRMHISHDVGAYALKEAQQEAVESYASELVDNAEVVVMGFADSFGEASANVRISKERASVVATKLQSLRPDVTVTSLSSILWPGDPENARRTEMVEVRSSKRR